MNHSNWKIPIAIVIASIFVSLIICPFRAINLGFDSVYISSFVGFFGYFAFTYFACRMYEKVLRPSLIFEMILLGILIVQVPIRIISPIGTLATLPDFIIHLLGIIFGYLFYRKKMSLKVAIIAGLLVYGAGMLGTRVLRNAINFNTAWGTVSPRKVSNFMMKDEHGTNHFLNQFKGTYLILDCWYDGCGVCFHKFPEFQKVYKSYSSDKNMVFFALNVPYKESGKDPYRLIREEGYSFPVLKMSDINSTKELEVKVFPTILIFNPNSQLIFRGDLDDAKRLIKRISKKDI